MIVAERAVSRGASRSTRIYAKSPRACYVGVMLVRFLFCLCIGAGSFGCLGPTSGSQCLIGSQGCACTLEGGCASGLMCASSLCVDEVVEPDATTDVPMDERTFADVASSDTASDVIVDASVEIPGGTDVDVSSEITADATDAAADDCTTEGCSPGFTCDPTSKLCEENAGGTCNPCTSDIVCKGAGAKCIPVGGDNVCAPPCWTSDDCATGWVCFSNQCLPGGFSCTGCAVTGCGPGQACETTAGGSCQPEKASCEACTYDWECGIKGACHAINNNHKVCVPRCKGDVDCAADGAVCLIDQTTNYKVCSNAGCVSTTTCEPECFGTTPHCSSASVCVQCLNDDDCGAGEACDVTTGTCSGTNGCQPPTPIFSPEKGQCVQCTEDSQCSSGTCNIVTNTCDGDVCSTCVAPYPACGLVGTDYYCVECTTDAECGQNGSCNLQFYSCQ